jgi:excisionase family DNA binding protein
VKAATDPLSHLIESAVLRAIESAGVGRLPRCMTREQAAEYLGIEPEAVDRLHHCGKIRRVRISERVFRYDREELDRFVRDNQ